MSWYDENTKTEMRGLVALLALAPPETETHSVQYLCFYFVISEAQVLKVGGCIRLNRWELVLKHVNDFRQFWISPSKLPSLGEHIQGKKFVVNVCVFTKWNYQSIISVLQFVFVLEYWGQEEKQVYWNSYVRSTFNLLIGK